MPFKWVEYSKEASDISGASLFNRHADPRLQLVLWPHRSLSKSGFVWFIALTFAMFMLPLIALVGTPALWGLLPFVTGALGLVWYSLQRSYKDAALNEVLTFWDDRIELVRTNPNGRQQKWHANPHWVKIDMRVRGGSVENYVTLRGNQRTVEIGAFLSPDERHEMYQALSRELG